MKILHITNDLEIAGAQKVMLDLAIAQHNKGHEVKVGVLNLKPTFFYKSLIDAGIEVIDVSKSNNIYNPLNIAGVAKAMRNCDIVHSHLFPSQYWVSAAKTIFNINVPIVTTEHSTTNKRRGKKIFGIMDRISYKRYDLIAGCSQESAYSFNKDYPGLVATAIPNGVNIDNIINSESLDRNEFNCTEGDIIITMVARFANPKRQDLLIKAMEDTPDNMKLVLVGEGEGMEDCQKLAKESGYEKRIIFTGLRSDVGRILKTSDIVALISGHEGLSLSCIEGMASGAAFIGSNVPGLRDIVAGAGMLVDNDANNIHDALMQLCDKEVRLEIAASCQRRARQYDADTMAEKYLEAYKEILSHR